MPDAAQTTQPLEHGAALDYDAFLSYTHGDRPVVSGIQKGLHHIGRRVGQLRALRVFRDDTDLTASPDLWGRITDALDRSRFLIVTLSPQAAQSHWVNKEIAYWLEHREPERLMLAVADGHVRWDETDRRFDPQASDAAPPALTELGSLPIEPVHIDVTGDEPWDDRIPVFRDKVTTLAAAVHGKTKDQLIAEDVRAQRRFRQLRAAAIAALAVLTVVAVVAATVAVVQRQHAIERRNQAIALKLDTEASAMLAGVGTDGDIRAFQQLLAARTLAPPPHDGPLLHALAVRSNTEKIVDTGSPLTSVAFSPNGHVVATGSQDSKVQRWNADTGQPLGVPLTGHSSEVDSLAFSPDGRKLASASADNTVRLWNSDTGQSLGPPLTGHTNTVWSVAFSPDGHKLATASADKTVRLWNADTGQPLGPPLTGHTESVRSVAFQSRRS